MKKRITLLAFILVLSIWIALAEDCETCNTSALSGEADYYDEGLQMYSSIFFKGTNYSNYGILVVSCDFPNNTETYNIETVVHASTYSGKEIDLTPFKLKVWDSQGSGVNPGKASYINPENELGIGQLTRSFSLMIHTDHNKGTCIFRAEVWDQEENNLFAELTLVWQYGERERKPADEELIRPSGGGFDFFGGLQGGQIVMIGLMTVMITTWSAFWVSSKASFKS